MRTPPEILTGKATTHLESVDPGSSVLLHRETAAAFRELREEARRDGFEPLVVSGFRDYAGQLRIWNGKARGERPVLDENSQPLDLGALTREKLLFAILRWSAMPGASRHHWGTDFDVVDAKGLTDGYRVQLIPSEMEGDGPFAGVHAWLDENMARFGFFRPYAADLGGVSPERWHLSHRPVSGPFYDDFTLELLMATVESSEMELKDVALAHARTVYQRFVRNITHP